MISTVFTRDIESRHAYLKKEIISNVDTIFYVAIPILKHPELKKPLLFDTQTIHRLALPLKIGGLIFLVMITVKERTDFKDILIDEFTIYDLYSQVDKNKKLLLIFIFQFNRIFVMNNILLNIKKFKKEHKFLFIALVMSWILGLFLFIPSVISLIKFHYTFNSDDYLRTLIFLISPISISIISFITCKTMIKYPKLSKWISTILNLGFILYGVVIFGAAIFLIVGYVGAWYLDTH